MIDNSHEPKNKEFFAVFSHAMEIGLDIIKTLERQNTPIKSHLGYRTVRFKGNGLPVFYDSGLKNYGQPFGLDNQSTVNCNQNPVFRTFINFAKQNDTIRKHFEIPASSEISSLNDEKEAIFEKLVLALISNTIDLYIHKNRDGAFSPEWLKPYYREIERGIFDETLQVDILVPILMLAFDFDSIWLNKKVALFKMNNEAQESRAYLQDLDPKVHWAAANVTSHAFLFKDYKLKNKGYWGIEEEILKLLKENDELINNYFAMLKVVTDFQTGYAQILINPTMWSFYFMAHLPTFIRKSVRNYPSYFDDEFHKSIPVVKVQQLEKLKQLQANQVTITNKRIKLALRRLNNCLLRDNEEDKILDAVIGLEALFGDSEKQEMTHKLALRAGIISTLDSENEYNSVEIMKAVKTIYSYRSAVAHGSKNVEKKRFLEIGSKKITSVEFAIALLRNSIITLLENQKFLEPSKIDEELLLNIKTEDGKENMQKNETSSNSESKD